MKFIELSRLPVVAQANNVYSAKISPRCQRLKTLALTLVIKFFETLFWCLKLELQ